MIPSPRPWATWPAWGGESPPRRVLAIALDPQADLTAIFGRSEDRVGAVVAQSPHLHDLCALPRHAGAVGAVAQA